MDSQQPRGDGPRRRRTFEEDERQTALHEVPTPGLAGGAMTGFLVSGRSAEEHVAEILRPVGPLIAVGAPGAAVPRLPECPAWLDTRHRTVIQGVIYFAADWTPSTAPVVDDYGNATSNLFTAMMPALLPAFTAIAQYEKETGVPCG